MSTITRLIASIALVIVVGLANQLLAPISTLASAEAAGLQLQNSDAAYVYSAVGMSFASRLTISGIVTLIGLTLIWIGPARRGMRTGTTLAALLAATTAATPAAAYYDKSDYTEATTIYPNETAFWIPDNGGNKDSQGKMDSAAYYEANRVALKRFVIPHGKFSGSGAWTDYYVPAGRLIVVDRTPYNREWTAASHRGTSKTDESFPCQDKEGHDITVEVAIGTSVFEADAAKFLYRFGVKPPAGDRTNPTVVFTSVYYSRSLTEVMDTVGRGTVQALVCSQISVRGLDQVNLEADKMLAAVREGSIAALAPYGITIDYIGWAGTFTFAPEIQAAINRRYIADQDQKVAQQLQPYTATIQALAAAEAVRSFGSKSDGKLPTTILGLPSNVAGLLQSLLGTPAAQQTTIPGAAR